MYSQATFSTNLSPDWVYPFINTYYAGWSITADIYPTNVYYESESVTTNYTESFTGITGLTIAQMQDSSSYTNWDFENIWTQSFDYQNGYPYFRLGPAPPAPPAPILPSFTILYPNGGELFFYNEMIPISWSFTSGTL